ncbi:MAG: STAS domain-containing protein [Candidatus Aquicultor sp.]
MLTIDIIEKGSLVFVFSGAFDISEKKRVDDLVLTALSNNPRGVIFDLASIAILDSSAIGLLISYQTMLRQSNTTMAVVLGSNNYLAKKLTYLGIFNDSGISLFDTVEEAQSFLV